MFLYPLQRQNQHAPYTQNPNIVQNLNIIIVNNATNNTTKYVILNLIASGRWRQIAFSRNVNYYRQRKKSDQ